MPSINLKLAISDDIRLVTYFQIEGRVLDANHWGYQRVQGDMYHVFDETISLSEDRYLNLHIIIVGQSIRSDPKLSIIVNGSNVGTFKLSEPINRNGYGSFKQDLKVL